MKEANKNYDNNNNNNNNNNNKVVAIFSIEYFPSIFGYRPISSPNLDEEWYAEYAGSTEIGSTFCQMITAVEVVQIRAIFGDAVPIVVTVSLVSEMEK